jgi:hypothetical protein
MLQNLKLRLRMCCFGMVWWQRWLLSSHCCLFVMLPGLTVLALILARRLLMLPRFVILMRSRLQSHPHQKQ